MYTIVDRYYMTMKERLGASLYRRYRMSNDNCECNYAILFLFIKPNQYCSGSYSK